MGNISSLNIFLADDDHDDCYLFEKALANVYLQADLRIVHDGQAMLDELNYEKPDTVVLDLNMPVLSGYECICNMKSDPQLKSIPTVILTTSRSTSDIEKLEKIGTDLFISKPNTFRELLEVTRKIVKFVLF